MDFELTEEQKSIIALIKDFCQREKVEERLLKVSRAALSATNVEELRAFMPWDLVEKAHDVGLRQLAVPERYGGGGASWLTLVVAGEAAGYWGGPLGKLLSGPWKHCANTATLATKEQQDFFFSQFMKNHRLLVASATSEPDGSTDIYLPYDEPGVAMKTWAYKDGDEWVLNGSKMYSSGGAVADLILVAARTDKKGPISQSMTSFWVPRNTPGLQQTLNKQIIEPFTGNVQHFLDNVRVPESHLIGEVNKGWKAWEARIMGKFLHFANDLGTSEKLYESMRDYAKQRIQGGKPIFEHLNVGTMIAEAAVNLEATRLLFYKAAWEYDREQQTTGSGLLNPLWSSYCKYYFKKMAFRLCEIGAEVYAGIGTTKEMPFESYVRMVFSMYPAGYTGNMNLVKCMAYL